MKFSIPFFFHLIYVVVCFYDLKEFYPFDDTRLYKLTWEKPDIELLAEVVEKTQDGGGTVSYANPYEGLESLKMKTANGEEHLCYLPNKTEEKKDEMLEYTGPNPIQLMMPLMSLLTCSYKIESYWTYELCHGRHLRQYHEERDAKKQKLQEYFLGYYDKDKLEALDKQFEENPLKAKDVPLRKIDSLTLPYLEIKMDGGTVCDLSGKPRSTKVIYVCHPPGKHEIYSIEEVSTCEYEVVVLTPSLCKHPLYKPVESSEKKITCTPIGENPKRPVALMELESESLLLRHQNILESFGLGSDSGIQIEVRALGPKDSENLVTLLTTAKSREPTEKQLEGGKGEVSGPPEIAPTVQYPVDEKLIEDFLKGDYCLYGGTGWWRYEFCYGKKVNQFHEEGDGTKTVIHLGSFNRENHLKWLQDHTNKRPKPHSERKQVSQYYTGGSVCDTTKKSRSVEVKLKCKEPGLTQNAISLYLLEPHECEYVLGVEAGFLCPLIQEADENGEIDLQNVLKKRVNL